MNKRTVTAIFAAFGIFLLIMDAETALSGAREAVGLCAHVVIPSLFPFIVLINLLNSTFFGTSSRMLRPLERFLKIPEGSGCFYLSGLLGGYPTGAQLIADAGCSGKLLLQDANRMLRFCSNAGPAFLFGIIAPQFTEKWIPWLIWAIHILSSIAVARLTPTDKNSRIGKLKSTPLSVSDALERAISVIACVCGWIVLFRILTAFSQRWFLWLFPTQLQVIFIAIAELANGASCLSQVPNTAFRMIVAASALNFGGICVLMQTVSVSNGLKIGDYLKGKILQTCIGLLLSLAAQYIFFPSELRIAVGAELWLSVCLLFILLTAGQKLTVAFRRKMVYNRSRKQREE